MNAKILLMLAALLALLLAAYLLMPTERVTQNGGSPGVKAGEPLLPAFDPSKARSIAIKKGDRSVTLAWKDGARWNIATLKDRRANLQKVRLLLTALHDATVRGDRPGSLQNFGLDPERRTALEVLGEGGAPLAKLWIGNSAQFEACFAMTQDGETALELYPDLESMVGMQTEGEARALNPESWYDLVICQYRGGDAIEFAVKRGHETIRVQKTIPGKGPLEPKTPEELKQIDEEEAKKSDAERKSDPKPVWWITEPEGLPANEGAAASVYNNGSQLYAKGYADDIKPELLGFDPPTAKTRVVLRDGTAYTFILGAVIKDAEGKETGLVKLEGEPDVWKIEGFTHHALCPTLAALKKETPGGEAKTAESPETKTPEPHEPKPNIPEAPPVEREVIPDAPPPAAPEKTQKTQAPPAVLQNK
ncbi:MAG: hypothetical protein KIS92_17930 [Planctomycetota bacterium]|nr:hypothetical protein [Planctomycetota bacterium]